MIFLSDNIFEKEINSSSSLTLQTIKLGWSEFSGIKPDLATSIVACATCTTTWTGIKSLLTIA